MTHIYESERFCIIVDPSPTCTVTCTSFCVFDCDLVELFYTSTCALMTHVPCTWMRVGHHLDFGRNVHADDAPTTEEFRIVFSNVRVDV